MDRQEYPAMLATLQPSQAIDVLQDRVKQVGSLNAHIADWLAERKRIEEQYCAGLRKLARRPPPGDVNELGIFSVPWKTLTNALESMAESHHAFATNIEADVEKPLRNFTFQDRQMQAMNTISGNLASMARDIEAAEKKNERLAAKGQKAKTMNVANATTDLETAQSQWDSQAPYVFEQLQAVDETRLNKLRDALTQFQTHEVDRVERERALAEQCLNVVLNVETADEIKTFALRVTSGRPNSVQRQRSRHSVIGPITPALAPPVPHVGDDAASQRSESIPAEPEKKSGGLKGLKRLGTVLGRRRESKIMLPNRGSSESPERKPKGGSAFNSFAGRLGRGRDMPTPLEESDEDSFRPRSPLRTMTSSNDIQEAPAIDGSAQSLAAAGFLPNGSNGYASHQGHQADVAQLQAPLQPSAPEQSQPASRDSEAPKDSEGYSLPPSHIDAISQAERDASEAAENASPAYNVNIRNAPIAEEGNDDVTLASLASTLKMQGPPTVARRTGTLRGRRDNRASVYAPNLTPEPVPEESSAMPTHATDMTPSAAFARDIDNAMSPPATAHGSASSPSAPAQSTSNSALSLFPATSTAFSATQSPTSPSFPPQSAPRADQPFNPYHGSANAANIFRPGSSLGHGIDHDAQSIRSGRSLSSSASQGASKHPEMHNTGLNSSIIETVSAWFENDACVRSVVIGEVALAYNPADFNHPFGHETIRLDGFDKLEKVAPNPTFISDSGTKGEYTVNLAHIQKTSVAFKYQLAPSSGISAGEYAPLMMSAAWKVEGNTTMCIVSYRLNPAFVTASGASSVTLNNVTIILHLGSDGAKAQTCQSKPVGVFDRTRNLVYWKLGESTTLTNEPKKLLAKFTTTGGEATPGNIEAKWEMLTDATGSGLAVAVKDEGDAANAEADPFADERTSTEAAWKTVAGPRKLIAGTYSAYQ